MLCILYRNHRNWCDHLGAQQNFQCYLKFLCCWTQNHLMECLLADVTLVCLLTRMRESMVFIVALLVEAFPAKFTNIRSVSLMYPHMRIKGWTSIEGLSASTTFMRLVWRVNDFVSAKGRGLAKSFATNFANKWSSTWNVLVKRFSNIWLPFDISHQTEYISKWMKDKLEYLYAQAYVGSSCNEH